MIYVVERGDTLTAIAAAFGTSVARLRSDNGIPVDQPLVPGQALVVLVPEEVYTVRAGDTLYGIAARTGVTVGELLRRNPVLASGQGLYPGETLTVRLREGGEQMGAFLVNGYAYPHIGQTVLRRALPFLSRLSVFSYGFRLDGTLIVPEDGRLLAEARLFGATPVLVLTTADEAGAFNSYKGERLFRDPDLQSQVLDRLLAVMGEKGYQGLDADFEYIAPEDAGAYLAFLENAAARLHARGWFLHADLAPKTSADQKGLLYEAHEYPAIGAVVDSALVMTYEWGYAYGPPMAVAPLPQVRQVMEYAVSAIPAGKLQMGIPNYGYDWTLPYERERRAVTLGNQEAVALAARVGAEIQFDETAQSPTFEYIRAGERHRVWFEDARSLLGKLTLARDLGVRGLGWWNLLRPWTQGWAVMSEVTEILRE